jgi:hypothetical protein
VTSKSAPIDYRQTFLRRHVGRQLALDASQSWWEGIQAFRDLRLPGTARAELSLEAFLYGGGPAALPVLHHPVPIQRGESETQFLDLVDLLSSQRLSAPASRSSPLGSIVLEGPGGSGKTISLYRAFFACFRPSDRAASPPLAGYCPCWIHCKPNATWADWTDALAFAAFGEAASAIPAVQIRTWVRRGPPLLLLCDLDAIPAAERVNVVTKLRQFCEEQHNDPERPTRCVVAWSGSDVNVRSLLDEPHFSRCYLRPWSRAVADGYATAWRQVALLAAPDSESGPVKLYPDELRPSLVHRFLTQQHRCAEPVTRGQLVHAVVNSLRGEIRATAAGLAQAMNPGPQITLNASYDYFALAGTTRLATRLLHGPVLADHLVRDEIDTLLRIPQWASVAWYPPDTDPPWWVRLGRLYYDNTRLPESALHLFVRLVLERSPFLRTETDAVRFLDCMAEYFEGVMATRFFEGPFQPDWSADVEVRDEDWAPAVLCRWTVHPERFAGAAFLLGGMLTAQDVRAILGRYLRSRGRDQRRGALPRLLPLLHSLLRGWLPQQRQDRFLSAFDNALEAEQHTSEPEVVGSLRAWFEDHAHEHTPEFDRLAGLGRRRVSRQEQPL